MAFSPPSARSSSCSSARKQAVSEHRRKRFHAADARHGRQVDYEVVVRGEAADKISMRCGAIEERLDLAEDRLETLLGDVNLLRSFRQFLRDPSSLEAAAAAASSERRASPPLADVVGPAFSPSRPRASGKGQRPGFAWMQQEHEQPRHASYAATSASKLAVACDAKLLHGIQSSIEELRASQQHNQQMLTQCQAQSAATQTELHEMKAAAAVAQSTFRQDVSTMQNHSAGAQTRSMCNTDAKECLLGLEAYNRSLPTDAIDIQEVLNKWADSFNKKIELFAAEQSSKLRAVSHSLVCLTSDFEIFEARFADQLSAIEKDQERQGRALHGHLALSPREPRGAARSNSRDSLARSSHEKITSLETALAELPQTIPATAEDVALKEARGMLGSLHGKLKHFPPSSQDAADQ